MHLIGEQYIFQHVRTFHLVLHFLTLDKKMEGSMVEDLVTNILSLVVAHIPLSFWAHDLYVVVAADAVGA